MNRLILLVLLSVLFGNPKFVHATISELKITSGASFIVDAPTPTAYGGVAGSVSSCDPESIANKTTCNNCNATIGPCNEQRIYPELLLRVEFKSDKDFSGVAGAKIRFKAGTASTEFDPDESSTTFPVNTMLFAAVSWSKICGALGNVGCAQTDLTSLQNIQVGINSGTLDEVATFQVQVVGNTTVAPTYTYHSDCGGDRGANGLNEGFCYFKIHKGDSKAYVQDETAPNDTYNRTVNGVTYKAVRFYYEEGNIRCEGPADAGNFSIVNPQSPYYDIATTLEGTDYYLDDNKLSDLENGKRYYFRMANVDIAGNVYYFSSAVGDPLVTGGTIAAFLNCADHSVVPEEVIGLLDGKSDFSCFIATAVYGSTMANELEILRTFRDRFLKTNFLGRAFVKWYYAWGPKYANWIKKKSYVRTIVRGFLWPVVLFAKFSLWGGAAGIVLFMFGGLVFCIYGLRRNKKRG